MLGEIYQKNRLQYGAIHKACMLEWMTSRGGGGGPKAYTLYKSYQCPYTKSIQLIMSVCTLWVAPMCTSVI